MGKSSRRLSGRRSNFSKRKSGRYKHKTNTASASHNNNTVTLESDLVGTSDRNLVTTKIVAGSTDTVSTLTASSTTSQSSSSNAHRLSRYERKSQISQMVLKEETFNDQCNLLKSVLVQPEFSDHAKHLGIDNQNQMKIKCFNNMKKIIFNSLLSCL